MELDEAATATATSTVLVLGEEYYGVPVSLVNLTVIKSRLVDGLGLNGCVLSQKGLQVKAAPSLLKNKKKNLLQLVEEEKKMSSQTETPRTPNVVARLMGLEILPDGATTPALGTKSQVHSPRISMEKKRMNEPPPHRRPLQKIDTNLLPDARPDMGYRSLPETPRASAERSRGTDPRLSLQIINKENFHNNRAGCSCEAAHSLPPSPTACYVNKPRRSKESSFKFQDENKSPRSHYYAREIVKQAKENTHHRRENSNAGGGAVDRLSKSRRTRPADKRVTVESTDSEQYFTAKPSPTTSPPSQTNTFFDPPKPQGPPKLPRPQPTLPSKAREHVEPKTIKMEPASKCKKASFEKFTERIKRQLSQSEKATLSDSLLGDIAPPVPTSSWASISASSSQRHSKKEARPTQEQQPVSSFVMVKKFTIMTDPVRSLLLITSPPASKSRYRRARPRVHVREVNTRTRRHYEHCDGTSEVVLSVTPHRPLRLPPARARSPALPFNKRPPPAREPLQPQAPLPPRGGATKRSPRQLVIKATQQDQQGVTVGRGMVPNKKLPAGGLPGHRGHRLARRRRLG